MIQKNALKFFRPLFAKQNQMDEKLEKIKSLLTETKSLAILADENCEEFVFLLKNALESTFQNSNIKTLTLPKNENLRYYEKWINLLPKEKNNENRLVAKTLLKIPKKSFSIKELSYEEDENFFSLIITPRNGEGGKLTKEIAIFEESLPEVETAICFFENAKILEKFKTSFKMPHPEKIVFLTNHQRTLTETTFNLIKTPDKFISKECATLFFASLIIETENFNKHTEKNIFALAETLIKNNADQKAIKKELSRQKTNSFNQLFGRALARSFYEDYLDLFWIFLSQKDFQKTNSAAGYNLSLKILEEIQKTINWPQTFIILWQNEHFQAKEKNNILGIIKSDNKNILLEINNSFDIISNNWLKVGPFDNFSEAEIKLRSMLKMSNALKMSNL
jgi:hypothetical protein